MSSDGALQLALDGTELDAALAVVGALRPAPGRVEAGTPLLASAGLAAVRGLRAALPLATVVADVKICDAGERMARAAFSAGADVVTVVGAVVDATTWSGALVAAQEAGGRLLVDLIGWEPTVQQLAALLDPAAAAGVPVELCVHRPKQNPPGFEALRSAIADAGRASAYVVAGKLTPESVGEALAAGFGELIVGGAVVDSPDPQQVWARLHTEIESWRRPATAERN